VKGYAYKINISLLKFYLSLFHQRLLLIFILMVHIFYMKMVNDNLHISEEVGLIYGC